MTQDQKSAIKQAIEDHAEGMIDAAIDGGEENRQEAIKSIRLFFRCNRSHIGDCFVDTYRTAKEIVGAGNDTSEVLGAIESGIVDYVDSSN